MKDLSLFDGAKVLDVPCGIGNHALWMLQENSKITFTGVDIAKKLLDYAKDLAGKNYPQADVIFQEGDINTLAFPDNSFDYIWCCDGLWPGPKEMGCLAETPYDILKNFMRIAKPGAKIAVAFWSSQKLLPGYPYVESALNNTNAGNRPFKEGNDPDLHILRTPAWFKKVGLNKFEVKTYAADISGLDPDTPNAMPQICAMMWGAAEVGGSSQQEVSSEIWQKFKDITNPESENCIFKKDDYAGFLTYTSYIATVEK
ncbi:hypothetical protein CSB45_14665 [candidate division KSB3 bacterium]|uniref:Methyltransferase domain-containing protein n=1 Tax=candidate division KSB3 bacterium TaxID=2044937 RepID=A0A2G6E0X2_9BACT|nr:MAG: hypothetical protein CSB45_14665 [candidate division KSB3 bacterium]